MYQIIHEDEPIPLKNLFIVIYGDPGCAKTSLSFTAENPVLLDFDDGVKRSVGRKTTIQFDTWEDTIKFVESEDFKNTNCKTLILDTGGTMLDDYIGAYVIKKDDKNKRSGGELSLQGYGAMKTVFDSFRQTLTNQGVDVIVVCHKTTDDDNDNKFNKPKMTGGSLGIVMAKADLCGYMEINNNVVTLDFNPTSRHFGKNCTQFKKFELPHFNKPEWSGFMARLIQQTKDHITKKGEAEVAAIEQMNDLKAQLNKLTDVEEINDFRKKIYDLSPIYQAQLTPVWQAKYVEAWAKHHLTTKCTSPEDFDVLSDLMQDLPKYIKDALRPLVSAHMARYGVKYIKDKGFEIDDPDKQPGGKNDPDKAEAAASGKKSDKPANKPAEVKADDGQPGDQDDDEEPQEEEDQTDKEQAGTQMTLN